MKIHKNIPIVYHCDCGHDGIIDGLGCCAECYSEDVISVEDLVDRALMEMTLIELQEACTDFAGAVIRKSPELYSKELEEAVSTWESRNEDYIDDRIREYERKANPHKFHGVAKTDFI